MGSNPPQKYPLKIRHAFFNSIEHMKKITDYFFAVLLSGSSVAKAQTVDSLYMNLYTDSLKKGTFNYINADGLMSTGRYLPLDTTKIILTTSSGYFQGNSLWIPADFNLKKVIVTVTLRSNKSLTKTLEIPIKQLPDGPLKTAEELMREMKQQPKRKN